MTDADRLAALEARVALLHGALELNELRHQRCHAAWAYHDGLHAMVIAKAADLLGRVLLADEALVPADILRSALELHAVWDEASA